MGIFSLTINRATNSFADQVVTTNEPSIPSRAYSANPDVSKKATEPVSGDLKVGVLQNLQDMQAFENSLTVEERWSIVAYIRRLQRK